MAYVATGVMTCCKQAFTLDFSTNIVSRNSESTIAGSAVDLQFVRRKT